MAPQFKVLERFSEEARRKVAGRNFAKRHLPRYGMMYSCARGLCVMAALLEADGKPVGNGFPMSSEIAAPIGVEYNNEEDYEGSEYHQICAIMELNDTGSLRTNKAVRALLLGDENPS